MSGNQSQVGAKPAYHLVFIALAVLTAVEVGVSYLAPMVKVPLLVILSGTKAVLVALYFMHLKSDSRVFAWPLVLGLVVIVPIVLILSTVLPYIR